MEKHGMNFILEHLVTLEFAEIRVDTHMMKSETWIFMTNGKSLPDCMEKAYRYNAFALMFTRARWYSHPTLGNDYYFTCKLLFQSGEELPRETPE